MKTPQQAIEQLAERRERLIAYLKMKVDAEDYHGVADAAMDLREVDAELKVYSLMVS